MKTQEILNAIPAVNKKGADARNHAKVLAEVYAMVKEIRPRITKVVTYPTKFSLGGGFSKNDSVYRRHMKSQIEGNEVEGERMVISTANADYSVNLPLHNDFYRAFRDLVKEFLPDQQTVNVPMLTLEFDKAQTSVIKQAMRFIKYDQWQTVKNNVLVEVRQSFARIVATDGYRLFNEIVPMQSEREFDFKLPILTLKSAIKPTLKVELFENQVLQGDFEYGYVNGTRFEHCNERFPDYQSVIPQYTDFVEVARLDLLQAVKSVLPSVDKQTKCIELEVNGKISVKAVNDWTMSDCKVVVGCFHKSTPDFKISLNGQYLVECLEVQKDFHARIFTNGEHNRAILVDRTVLMPINPDKWQ